MTTISETRILDLYRDDEDAHSTFSYTNRPRALKFPSEKCKSCAWGGTRKKKFFLALLSSRAPRASRMPLFLLCLPKIRKKIHLFCWLPYSHSDNTPNSSHNHYIEYIGICAENGSFDAPMKTSFDDALQS